jgi:hypothetical protein
VQYPDDFGRDSMKLGGPSFGSTMSVRSDTCTLATNTSEQLACGDVTAYEGTTVVGPKSTTAEDTPARADTFEEFERGESSSDKPPNWDVRNADIQSLMSEDDNDTQEEGPVSGRPEEGRYVETVVVKYLAANSALRPFYETASQLLPRHRFVNNFRRLLRIFRDDLSKSPTNLVMQELAARLRFKEARTRIANRITDE